MQRIDVHPTHEYQGYKIRSGKPFPFGASLVPGGVNFSVFSRHANYCVLVHLREGRAKPIVEIPFRGMFAKALTRRAGLGRVPHRQRFHHDRASTSITRPSNTASEWTAAFPVRGRGSRRCTASTPRRCCWTHTPRAIGGRDVWGQAPDWNAPFQHRSRVVFDDFDWEGDRPLEIPLEDLVVYEMHVRGFTRHPSSGARRRRAGTFAGMREKIPYLKELGVNCVELMPIYEFDEFENSRWDAAQGRWAKMNYWGYSTVGFFSPKAGLRRHWPDARRHHGRR